MAAWRDAVQGHADGTRLLVEVAAGARDARFPDGFNRWREGRIGIRVRAPAQDGRANAEVLANVAAFFDLGAARVRLDAGATDARKALVLASLAPEDAVARLAPFLDVRGAAAAEA